MLDATQGWLLVTDEAELAGLPARAPRLPRRRWPNSRARRVAVHPGHPSYLPVMMYADSRALRAELYEAFTTRASDQGPQRRQIGTTPPS